MTVNQNLSRVRLDHDKWESCGWRVGVKKIKGNHQKSKLISKYYFSKCIIIVIIFNNVHR